MRALAKRKHRYRPAFLEAGRRLRKLNVSPKRAGEYLRTHPIEWSDGLNITAIPQTGRILVMRGADELASISEEQFRKECMSFPPPAAGGKFSPGLLHPKRVVPLWLAI
jgi:hypothetical protein